MGLFNFEPRKTINQPKLKLFSESGWNGFKDEARLSPLGIEPLIAELNYNIDGDYIIILIANTDDGTDNSDVQILSPYRRYHKIFNNDSLAISCGYKLTKKLATFENSEEAIEYCKENEFIPIMDKNYKP